MVRYSDFKDIFRQHQFDCYISCAAAVSAPDSVKNSARDYFANVYHLVQLLNVINDENSDCKLIQLLSAAVFGNPQVFSIKESHNLAPLSLYSFKKAEAPCKLCYDYIWNKQCCFADILGTLAWAEKQLFGDLYKITIKV